MTMERQLDRFLKARYLVSDRGLRSAHKKHHSTIKIRCLLLKKGALRTRRRLRVQGRLSLAQQLLLDDADLAAVAKHFTQGYHGGFDRAS